MFDEEDAEFYRNKTTAELIQLKREAIEWYADIGKEWNSIDYYDKEGQADYSARRRKATNVQNAIQKELDRQKEENKSGLNNLGNAVNSWFATQQLAVPEAVTVTWKAQDRYYSGRFYPDGGRLVVSIEVKPGTPGAQRRGPKSYLRCNTAADQRAAIIAESKADGHG